jgi:hypothetical protein
MRALHQHAGKPVLPPHSSFAVPDADVESPRFSPASLASLVAWFFHRHEAVPVVPRDEFEEHIDGLA